MTSLARLARLTLLGTLAATPLAVGCGDSGGETPGPDPSFMKSIVPGSSLARSAGRPILWVWLPMAQFQWSAGSV